MKSIFHSILNFRRDNLIYFYMIVLLGTYLAWKGYKEFYYTTDHIQNFGWRINDYLAHTHQYFISWILDLSGVDHQKFIVEVKNKAYPGIRLPGAGGVYLGHHCLAVTVTIVYTTGILLLPGSVRRKLLFLMTGIISIYLINSARLILLVYLDKYSSPTIFEIHHNIINIIVVYTFTLAMHAAFVYPVLSQEAKSEK